jgi:hypothetical protein
MEWQALFSTHVDIWARLRVPGVMSAARIDDLQLRMDAFCRLFVERFGWNNLTNYLHNIMGGHFRYFSAQVWQPLRAEQHRPGGKYYIELWTFLLY